MNGRWTVNRDRQTACGTTPCLLLIIFFLSIVFFPFDAWADATDNSPALAQRLVELSQNTLRAPQVAKTSWRQAIALLGAAVRLDPTEARYARLLVDAQLHVQDAAGATAALKAYRQLRPDDRVAQVQLIDLYVGQIQTADGKLNYLDALLKDQTLAAAVRSHVAVQAARVQWASLRHDQAEQSITEALKLNPLNMDALRMQYDLFEGAAQSGQRVGTLLAILKSNPAEAWAAQALSQRLADAGLVDLSTEWYRRSARVLNQLNQPMSPAVAVDYAAELYIFDQPQLAASLAQDLLKAYPADMDGLYIAMLCAKRSGNQGDLDQYSGQAINATLNRLDEAHAAAMKATATTRPINSPPPEIPDLAQQAGEMKNAPAAQRDAYVSALGDLAWIELYFKNDSASAARAMNALALLVPTDNLTLTRLSGWKLLADNRPKEAKVKWSSVADRDPLSELGLLRLETQNGRTSDQAKADAVKLINANPAGLLGAFVWDGVRALGVQRTISADAAAVRTQVQAFPRDWLDILDQPKQFYSLQFDPVTVGHDYTDPLIAQVTVRNVGTADLTIGSDGIIQPDLWIDAQLRGLNQRNFPGVAFDRLSDRLVLHPGESISRSVRVDQGALDEFLKSDPSEPLPVSAAVITNPVISQGGAVAGPAGERVELGRIFQRNGFPMNGNSDKQRLYDQLRNGDSAAKIRAASLLAAYIQIFRSDQATDAMKQSVGEMLEVLRKSGSDANPAVAGWAAYLHARLVDPTQRWGDVQAMAADPSWMKRLLALVAVQTLAAPQQHELAGPLGRSDEDKIVKSYAQSVMATVATSQPATGE